MAAFATARAANFAVRAHAGCGHEHHNNKSAASARKSSSARALPRRTPAPTAASGSGNVMAAAAAAEAEQVETFLDGLKYDDKGLVVAIVQDVDTGAILMQGFADRTAVRTTLTTRKATFFTRSRQQQWTKGETSGNFINVKSIHLDCDKDSLIYMAGRFKL
jgi:phosphoribosyl-ATP pyrophosphohydrolase/phosphoribosyl-AMP cyclohydrolase